MLRTKSHWFALHTLRKIRVGCVAAWFSHCDYIHCKSRIGTDRVFFVFLEIVCNSTIKQIPLFVQTTFSKMQSAQLNNENIPTFKVSPRNSRQSVRPREFS